MSDPYSFSPLWGPTMNIYSLDSYTFGYKDPLLEKDTSVKDRMRRYERMFPDEGIRRTVDGVVLVHQHGHPHVLLLQIGNTFFKLPGGKIKAHESEMEGLKRKLTTKLAPSLNTEGFPTWEVGELVSVWWRPNFETIFYPYIPPHITKPKECKKIFLVTVPPNCVFAVPKNLKLLAVPLFELYDNAQHYGPTIASIPHFLSRCKFQYH